LSEEAEILKYLEEQITATAGLALYAVPRSALVIVDVGEQGRGKSSTLLAETT
jgi:hypothetical protein